MKQAFKKVFNIWTIGLLIVASPFVLFIDAMVASEHVKTAIPACSYPTEINGHAQ